LSVFVELIPIQLINTRAQTLLPKGRNFDTQTDSSLETVHRTTRTNFIISYIQLLGSTVERE